MMKDNPKKAKEQKGKKRGNRSRIFKKRQLVIKRALEKKDLVKKQWTMKLNPEIIKYYFRLENIVQLNFKDELNM